MLSAALLRPARCALGVALALALLPAAARAADAPLAPGSPWPKFRGDLAQTGRASVAPRLAGAPWTFHTGKGIFSSPVIGADGTVYVGSADDVFYALTASGKVRWKRRTGEIIDSAALLDDRGRVYVPSADGHVYALDAATGRSVWTFAADPPSTTGAFINWFEGNVSMDAAGTLYAPNDNRLTYAIDRDTGTKKWAFATSDQTWSSPAFDAANDRMAFGSNFFLLGIPSIFSVDAATGAQSWAAATDGATVASPLVTAGGLTIVGSFDGYLRAYDSASGALRWSFATRDHLYASPAELPDGTIVQASADGSVYGVDPRTGALRWQYDTLAPIRSSPAVDVQGRVYVGTGDGRLVVLNANGSLRWAARLASGPGLVCAAYSIDRTDDGRDLCDPASDLRLEIAAQDEPLPIVAGPRVGIGYAPEPWRSRSWRFFVPGHPSVSRAGGARRSAGPGSLPGYRLDARCCGSPGRCSKRG